MEGKENKLFRQEALERLSSPERLDELMRVVNPRAWIPLSTLGVLALVGALWSVFGRIPLTVTGQGVLVQPRQVVQFQSPGTGIIIKLNVQAGSHVKKGDILATIDQSAIQQQLEQEKQNLALLLQQGKKSTALQKRRVQIERANLAKQRSDLEKNLKRESIVPELRQKNLLLLEENRQSLESSLKSLEIISPEIEQKSLASIIENRDSLKQQISQIKDLLPTLKDRLEQRRALLKKQLITGDVLLASEQEYLNNLAQVYQLESELKKLEVDEINVKSQSLQNQNNIDNIRNKIQELDVQGINVQRDYLQSLNEIDDLNTKLKQLDSQEATLGQQDLDAKIQKGNTIQQTRQKIAQLQKQLTDSGNLVSKYDGVVLEVGAVLGQIVSAGNRIGSIQTTDTQGQLFGVAYLPDKDGKQIKPGMVAQITPSIVKRERYGGIVGKVTEISPFPVTIQDIATIVGNEDLAQGLQLKGATVQIYTQLETDPDNFSGYKWSSSKGPQDKITTGTTMSIQIRIGEVAPISYIIPLFRSWTGMY